MEIIVIGGVFMAIAIVIVVLVSLVVRTCYVNVEQGTALVVNSMQRLQVSRQSAVVWPIIHKAEAIDLTIKTIPLRYAGRTGLICADNLRANLSAQFMVRINPTDQDILTVAQTVGCQRAGDSKTITELFGAKFGEALKTVARQYEFADLSRKLDQFREEVIQYVGRDLNGYFLEDLVIADVEQTPITDLDPQNILDAQGIRKITEVTTAAAAQVAELNRNSELQLRRFALEHPEVVRKLASYLG